MPALELSLPPRMLRRAVEHCVKVQEPCFIWGPPGVGKSEIVRAIAKFLGYVFIDIRMSQMDSIDLRGMPMIPNNNLDVGELMANMIRCLKADDFSEEKIQELESSFKKQRPEAKMIWALPEFLPTDPDVPVLIFFDEMNHALGTNLSACYQLIQEGRLGSYVLPPNCVCLAAGNRKEDYGSDFELPAPLADRFTHLEVRPDLQDFLDYGIENKVNPMILGFLKHKGIDYLYQANRVGKYTVFTTPRSWVRMEVHMGYESEDSDNSVKEALIAGRIGAGPTTEFQKYLTDHEYLPDPDDVLTGKVITLRDKGGQRPPVDVLFSCIISVLYRLKDFYLARQAEHVSKDEFNALGNNFLKFLNANCVGNHKGMLIMAMKTTVVKFKIELDYDEMPFFREFLSKHGDSLKKYVRPS